MHKEPSWSDTFAPTKEYIEAIAVLLARERSGERSEKFEKALIKQRQYLAGEPKSAKHIAHDLRYGLARFAVWGPSGSPTLAQGLREESLENMVKSLGNVDSDLFRHITRIATALNNRDSKFFRDIAAGLEQLPSRIGLENFDKVPVDKMVPMQFLNMAYTLWMRPWMTIWDLPPYQEDVLSGKDPLKQQLKELTKRCWAVSRLIKKGAIDWECATEKGSDEEEGKIAQEIKVLPLSKRTWTRLLIDAGLDHLREAKAGRPSRK